MDSAQIKTPLQVLLNRSSNIKVSPSVENGLFWRLFWFFIILNCFEIILDFQKNCTHNSCITSPALLQMWISYQTCHYFFIFIFIHTFISWMISNLPLNTSVLSPKNKNILLYKHKTIIKIVKLTYYHLIYRPFSNLTNCPTNALESERKKKSSPTLRSNPGHYIPFNYHVFSFSFHLERGSSVFQDTFGIGHLFYRRFFSSNLSDVSS